MGVAEIILIGMIIIPCIVLTGMAVFAFYMMIRECIHYIKEDNERKKKRR